MKRKDKYNHSVASAAPLSAGDAKATRRKPRVKGRLVAIMMNLDNQDFPALAKRIKGGIYGNVEGNTITGMRKTKWWLIAGGTQ